MKAYKFAGEPITVPGAYVDVDIDAYHAGPCVGRSVSASSLKRASRSMLHFWSQCNWNPDREPVEDTDALRLGKAAHVLALEPDRFSSLFAISPYDDYRTKEAREWKSAQSLLCLKQAELAELQRMANALRACPEAVALFRNGLPELTFAAPDEATGIWRLTRPDFTPAAAGRGLCDYKTAADASFEAFGRAAFNYGYDIQVALALDVVAEVTGEMRPAFWMVVQEKDPPYAVSVHRWEPDQIQYGRRRVRDLLDGIARCIEADEWPGYGEPQSLVTPSYLRKEIEGDL